MTDITELLSVWARWAADRPKRAQARRDKQAEAAGAEITSALGPRSRDVRVFSYLPYGGTEYGYL
jgi:hypothetical protein